MDTTATTEYVKTPSSSAVVEQIKQISGIKNSQVYDNSCFMLNGKKIIRVNSASDTMEKTEFRLENDEFSKIYIEYASVSGTISTTTLKPKKFVLISKDGTVSEYGSILYLNKKNLTTGKYEQDDNEFTKAELIWGLSSVKDKNGNFWTVEYNENEKLNGILIPDKIKYTGNASLQPSNSLDFIYTSLADGEKLKYVKGGSLFENGGSVTILNKKLSKINLINNNLLIGNYNLTYEDISATEANKTRLKSISYCGISGSDENCVSPSVFKWSSYGEEKFLEPRRDGFGIHAFNLPQGGKSKLVNLSLEKGSRIKQDLAVVKLNDKLQFYTEGAANPIIEVSNLSLPWLLEWEPVFTDFNNDQIQDLIIVGKVGDLVALIKFKGSYNLTENNKYILQFNELYMI